MKEIELYRLSTDEKIVHIPETRSIVVRFNAPKKVLSTSLLNGGYREDIKGLFNYTCCGPGPCMSLEKYEEHLGKCAAVMGLDPARSTGIGTAARMENAAIVEETYEELKVAACVTAGVEGNAGCAGDPAGYYGAGTRPEIYRPGTINILLFYQCRYAAGDINPCAGHLYGRKDGCASGTDGGEPVFGKSCHRNGDRLDNHRL